MKNQMSFTGLEHDYRHELRKRMNCCEDMIDLSNQFSYITTSLLKEAIKNEEMAIRLDDVLFDTKARGHYRISVRLAESPVFRQEWDHSDLPNILQRFAEMAYKHYVRISRYPAKKEGRIR